MFRHLPLTVNRQSDIKYHLFMLLCLQFDNFRPCKQNIHDLWAIKLSIQMIK